MNTRKLYGTCSKIEFCSPRLISSLERFIPLLDHSSSYVAVTLVKLNEVDNIATTTICAPLWLIQQQECQSIDHALTGEGMSIYLFRECEAEIRGVASEITGTKTLLNFKVVHGLEITSEADLFFNYIHRVTREDYKKIYEVQRLNVDFDLYPDTLGKMIVSCIESDTDILSMAYSDDAVVTESNLRFYYGVSTSFSVNPLQRSFAQYVTWYDGCHTKRETGDSVSEFYMRWQSFENHQQLQNALSGRDSVPYKMDIGAIYNKPVSLMQLSGSDFHAVERELVFDIDMNDYDDLRTCCSDKRICHKCWRFISIAAEILTRSLTEDFGFKEIMWVYSGRRGIHGWVCDAKARALPNEARSAIVDYLTLISADNHKKRANLFGTEDHPAVNRAFDICYRNFDELLRDQNFLSVPHHLQSTLEYITDRYPRARQVLQRAINGAVPDSVVLFTELCKELDVDTPSDYRNNKRSTVGRHDSFPAAFKELVLAFSYPRLDAAVTKDTGHLLKAPFCIHAKTEPEKIGTFRPEDVPTLRDMQGSPLVPYERFFRERFLQSCLINGAKGTVMSSLGVLLRSFNISCTAIKIDPYLNLDAGTMSPHEHGEVYVLEDGGEGDLDLGNYERFLNLKLTSDHSITTGKIFTRVFEKERRGCYLGKTVQVGLNSRSNKHRQMVPHVVDEIIDWVTSVSEKQVDRMGWRKPELCMLEIGGTVGDIESEIFMEAARQLKLRLGSHNVCLALLSYVPVVGSSNEQKSKPTQHSVKDVAQKILKLLDFVPKMDPPLPKLYTLSSWSRFVQSAEGSVRIALIGKYNAANDAYLSVMNALKHSAMDAGYALDLVFYEAEKLESDPSKLAVLDFVHEFDSDAVHGEMVDAPEEKQAIIAMPEFLGDAAKGGTMRLGVRDTLVAKGSLAYQLYDHETIVHERYRHRLNGLSVDPVDSDVKEQHRAFKEEQACGRTEAVFAHIRVVQKEKSSPGGLFHAQDLDTVSYRVSAIDDSDGKRAKRTIDEILDELEAIKSEASELIEIIGNIKLWIQLNVPRIEDGNNFGVGIQEEVILELTRVEDTAFNLFDSIVKYYMARAKLCTKVIKYPNVCDYSEAIRELDEKEWIHIKITNVDMRNNYSMIYDLLCKAC
ncbi:DNA primase small subunit [Babesia sp. Xinjiang]|uniref:DNA primase small subunit n=1 Tax=Babesia sp. Xinjiang TaxID=462227 RepID=UPI000A230BBA|nr:DNA primase small subunit [Babesia sp. Xinjiang]ORM41683.1 DNA primase small subunit [Babesia sp. Xinjiang]